MSKNAILCLLAAALLGGLAALAQEGDAPPADAAAEASGEAEEGPVSDDVFIPSEEVQAAEELTFPVNI